MLRSSGTWVVVGGEEARGGSETRIAYIDWIRFTENWHDATFKCEKIGFRMAEIFFYLQERGEGQGGEELKDLGTRSRPAIGAVFVGKHFRKGTCLEFIGFRYI